MQADVADRAPLVLDRLIMKGRCAGSGEGGVRVALQAEGVDVATVQQAWVLRAVRCVAEDASFDLDGRMLKGERAHLFCMAFCADCIPGGGSS